MLSSQSASFSSKVREPNICVRKDVKGFSIITAGWPRIYTEQRYIYILHYSNLLLHYINTKTGFPTTKWQDHAIYKQVKTHHEIIILDQMLKLRISTCCLCKFFSKTDEKPMSFKPTGKDPHANRQVAFSCLKNILASTLDFSEMH